MRHDGRKEGGRGRGRGRERGGWLSLFAFRETRGTRALRFFTSFLPSMHISATSRKTRSYTYLRIVRLKVKAHACLSLCSVKCYAAIEALSHSWRLVEPVVFKSRPPEVPERFRVTIHFAVSLSRGMLPSFSSVILFSEKTFQNSNG